jgi:hypothetical protein
MLATPSWMLLVSNSIVIDADVHLYCGWLLAKLGTRSDEAMKQ